MATPQQDELYATIDREAADERESVATKELYEALVKHRSELSGEGALPRQDEGFSERVHREAAKRSAEISAYRGSSGRQQAAEGAPIPSWLIALWVLAVIGALALFWQL